RARAAPAGAGALPALARAGPARPYDPRLRAPARGPRALTGAARPASGRGFPRVDAPLGQAYFTGLSLAGNLSSPLAGSSPWPRTITRTAASSAPTPETMDDTFRRGPLLLLAGRANPPLAAEIAAHFGETIEDACTIR